MKQGEIWLVALDPIVGSEIQKTRPVVIVNGNQLAKLPLKIIVPITDWKERYAIGSCMVRLIPDTINKLSKDSSADCFQVRSVAEQRLIKKIGEVDITVMESIRTGLATVLSIS